MMITTEVIVIRMKSDTISVIGRNTSGVKLMNIDAESDIKVARVAKVKETEPEEESQEIKEEEQKEESLEK